MVPIFGFLPAVVSILGTPLPAAVGGATVIAGVLGGATAVGSVKVAQLAALESGYGADLHLGPESNEVGDGR